MALAFFVAGFVGSRSAHSSGGEGGGGGGAKENIFIKKERTVAMKDCINKVVTTMTLPHCCTMIFQLKAVSLFHIF